MKAAIYARVSTIGNAQSPEMQMRELREYCERRGWSVAGEYVDVGISGANDSRPELNRLVADAHRRRFDAAIVWKFDRFARSVSHLLRALETFKALGIEFVSLSEQVDTSTPTGKMVFTVLGAVAELERSLIAERVRAGLRNARAKGKTLGRPRVAVDVVKIAAARARGQSWAMISKEMGIGRGTAQRALLMRILSFGNVAYAYGMVMLQAFNRAGDTMTPTIVNLVACWLVEIPLAYVLAVRVGWRSNGAYFAILISEAGIAAASIILFRRGRWKLKKI